MDRAPLVPVAKALDEKDKALCWERFALFDVCGVVKESAWMRNLGRPTCWFSDYLRRSYSPFDTKYYHANRAVRVEKGSIFSLDGIHASASGQSMVALMPEMSEHEELIDFFVNVINLLRDCALFDRVCLLYTSPSPRDATLSRMPSSA